MFPITDSTNTLTFGGATNATAYQGNSGQSMTLNLNTKFTNNNTIMVGGGTLTFGSSASPSSTTIADGGKVITFANANSTVNVYSSVSGGGTFLDQNVALNLGNSSGPSIIQLGKSGTNSIVSLNIITSGVTNSSSLTTDGGPGSVNQNTYGFGANITGGGTATYAGALNITPTGAAIPR